MLVVTEAALLSRRSMAQYRVLRSEGLTCGPGYRFGQRQVGPSSASRPATRVSPKSLISQLDDVVSGTSNPRDQGRMADS